VKMNGDSDAPPATEIPTSEPHMDLDWVLEWSEGCSCEKLSRIKVLYCVIFELFFCAIQLMYLPIFKIEWNLMGIAFRI
jgi:hypothetical protein